jgi:hypothetical protein
MITITMAEYSTKTLKRQRSSYTGPLEDSTHGVTGRQGMRAESRERHTLKKMGHMKCGRI